MSYFNTTTAQSFTTADLAALDLLAHRLAASIDRPVTVKTCADDGDEWAALVAAPEDGEGRPDDLVVMMSAQTTAQPGRRLVILADDGRSVLAAGDDLTALVPLVVH